jgi:ElaB/YqjD/DUF883 family membrane-anchored ribosome-binding protein
MGKDASEIRHEIEQTRQRLGETVDALQYKADVRARVRDAVTERVETVRGTISDAADGIKHTMEGASGKLPRPEDVRTAAQRGAGIAARNPLALVAAAFAAGFVAGLLLPVTAFEREKVGPIGDDLVERAADVGAETLSAMEPR